MNKGNIKKTLSHSLKESVFCQVSKKKICKKKSVYTDKISMSGRSVISLDKVLSTYKQAYF